MKNYYDELEVSKTASKEVIEKVYKMLAKKYHPDSTRETNKKIAEEKFKIISEAYDTLSNDEKRKKYDLELEQQNPTISYADYMDILNERDELQDTVAELRAKVYHYSSQFSQNFNNPYNSYRSYHSSNNTNRTNYYTNTNAKVNTNTKTKKYYYNQATGQPVSTIDYYKYKIKSFFSNLGFYLITLVIIIFIVQKLLSTLSNITFFI